MRWFYFRRGRWEPFGDLESLELETALKCGDEQVDFGGGQFPAILSQRVQHNYDAETQRAILRGTWFFQKSDGTLYPYPENLAAIFDDALLKGWPSGGVAAGDNKHTVYRTAERDVFAQEQSDTHHFRWVTRNYSPGMLTIKTVTSVKGNTEQLSQPPASPALTVR